MKSPLIVGVVALIIGFGAGYVSRDKSAGGADMSHESSMTEAMSGMTTALDGKEGSEFDKVFLEQMVVHHQGAVAMAELALKHAQHDEIKQLARDIIDAQTREISRMNTWAHSWYREH